MKPTKAMRNERRRAYKRAKADLVQIYPWMRNRNVTKLTLIQLLANSGRVIDGMRQARLEAQARKEGQ
jgi:hypothetical protein